MWGPPVWGAYPPLLYPGLDVGFGWYPGFDLGLYFGGWGGWGWGGWGWSPNWYGGGIMLNGSFFNRYGFRHFGGYGGLESGVWAHNPEHRLGVPYANRQVANRYNAGNRGTVGGRQGFASRGQQRMVSPGFEQRGSTANHSVFGGYHDGGMTRGQSDSGFASMGAGRISGGGGGFHGGGGGMHGGGGRR